MTELLSHRKEQYLLGWAFPVVSTWLPPPRHTRTFASGWGYNRSHPRALTSLVGILVWGIQV